MKTWTGTVCLAGEPILTCEKLYADNEIEAIRKFRHSFRVKFPDAEKFDGYNLLTFSIKEEQDDSVVVCE